MMRKDTGEQKDTWVIKKENNLGGEVTSVEQGYQGVQRQGEREHFVQWYPENYVMVYKPLF